MKHLTTIVLLALLTLVPMACGSGDDGNKLGQEGEDCASEADCEAGLECKISKCTKDEIVPDGDTDEIVTDGDTTETLVWQNLSSDSKMSWQEAKDYCNILELDNNNDWYLPNIDELRSLISGCPATEAGGSCNVALNDCMDKTCKDTACDGCEWNDTDCYWSAEMDGVCGDYWTSSSAANTDDEAWHISFGNGYVYLADTTVKYYVRCVR